MSHIRNIVQGKRMLVLPLESGINMQTGNLSYVTSNSVLQLETGADIVSDNAYGFGSNSSYILSSINDLIYNTYYFLHGNYSLDKYFISTANFSNFLTAFGIQYVLVVPGIPETPVNSYYPLVTYNMSKFFLDIQKNMSTIYSNDGYILYENNNVIPLTSQKIDGINSSRSVPFVSNFTSLVQWNYYNSINKIDPLPFDGGFMFNYSTNQSTVLVLPSSRLNISTENFSFMNINGRAVNATVTFYYVYEFGENYTFSNNCKTTWFPMTRYSQSYSSIYPSENFQNMTFSTQIPFLPWIGKGNISKIDWIEIAITPKNGLKPGSEFGFEINKMYFSNYSSSLSAISITLSKNANTDYIPINNGLNQLGLASLTSSAKITSTQSSESEYKYDIIDSNGSILLNLPVTYSPYWEYTIISGSENVSGVRHFETNGYQNSYLINSHGNATIEIFFEPQKTLFLLEIILFSMVVSEFIYVIYSFRYRNFQLFIEK